MVVVKAGGIQALKANWPALRCSVKNEECVVENSESLPSNKDVYDFVHAKVEAKDKNFKLNTFHKKGVFGREMNNTNRNLALTLKTFKILLTLTLTLTLNRRSHQNSPWDSSA